MEHPRSATLNWSGPEAIYLKKSWEGRSVIGPRFELSPAPISLDGNWTMVRAHHLGAA